MILKKEDTWHMFLDSQALNKLTIKDKFPIWVIDDLMDELHGVQFFTKLYLHPRYHQIKMKEANIPKIAFHTHEGHYEFLVMPLDFVILLLLFKASWKKTLKSYLRDFMLVFFDGIMIYSKT